MNNTNIDIDYEKTDDVSTHLDEQEIAQKISKILTTFNGVSRLAATGITENVTKNVLRKESPSQGIKVTRDDDILNISIHIYVYYGINIPQLSYDIQSRIKNSIENITGEAVKTVNITVAGIDRPEERDDKRRNPRKDNANHFPNGC